MTASESKFEEYDFYQPLLDAQITVFSPKSIWKFTKHGSIH